MHDDEVFDLLSAIDESASKTKAEQFQAQAESMPRGEYGRASFLLAAGEHWQMRKEYGAARRCFEQARDDGGETVVDPLADLHSLALETGDHETARLLALELRDLAKRELIGPDMCSFVAGTYEEHGMLREALRWYTIPLTWVEPDDGEALDEVCLIGRRRVRREELGLALDRFDRVADEAMEHQRQRLS